MSLRPSCQKATPRKTLVEFLDLPTGATCIALKVSFRNHGHHFQLVEVNGKRLFGAVRDTVVVPSMGTVVVGFNAGNPGRWLYHCHNFYHMAGGMMSEVVYV